MVWLVQDNEWDISAHSSEVRFGDATTFAKAFPGIEVLSVDGTDWEACREAMEHAIGTAAKNNVPSWCTPVCPLGHHTSGCVGSFSDDEEAAKRDPLPKLKPPSGIRNGPSRTRPAQCRDRRRRSRGFDAAQAPRSPARRTSCPTATPRPQ